MLYLEKCPHVSTSLDNFMETNCHLFETHIGEEHKLKHMELYQEYVTLVDKRMGEFVTHVKTTEEDFAAQVKEMISSNNANWKPLEEWLNRAEFEYFKQMMQKKHSTLNSKGGDEQIALDDDPNEDPNAEAPAGEAPPAPPMPVEGQLEDDADMV